MPENIPFDGAALRAQAIEDITDTQTTLVTDAFREGMSAGLDFAYRVVEDYRQSVRMNTRQAAVVDDIMSALVTEHDMRSEQPIRAIQVERASAQASNAMLAGLREALTAVEERNQEEVRAENTEAIRLSTVEMQPTCDGPCCRPESDPENVFDWVNTLPQHTSARAVTPTYVRCMCGDVTMTHRTAPQVLLQGVYHRANAPCYVADDPEPEERVPDLEHSCDCGEIPGLSSGQVTEATSGPNGLVPATVIIHRVGEPCTLGVDLATGPAGGGYAIPAVDITLDES